MHFRPSRNGGKKARGKRPRHGMEGPPSDPRRHGYSTRSGLLVDAVGVAELHSCHDSCAVKEGNAWEAEAVGLGVW